MKPNNHEWSTCRDTHPHMNEVLAMNKLVVERTCPLRRCLWRQVRMVFKIIKSICIEMCIDFCRMQKFAWKCKDLVIAWTRDRFSWRFKQQFADVFVKTRRGYFKSLQAPSSHFYANFQIFCILGPYALCAMDLITLVDKKDSIDQRAPHHE